MTATPVAAETERAAADIIGRSIRLRLGGEDYTLRVLFIAGNERWREYERAVTGKAVEEMRAAGQTMSEIREAFAHQIDLQLDLLYAYDTDCGHREGVLPPLEELKERIDEYDLDRAIREVVKATNPKATVELRAIAARQTAAARESASSASSSTPSRSGGKRPKKSGTH